MLRSGGTAPPFFTLALDWSGQSKSPATLPPEKRAYPYPLDRRLGGPQRRSGRCCSLPGSETPAVQLASRRYTELSRLFDTMISGE
jgi:hypothetical protein